MHDRVRSVDKTDTNQLAGEHPLSTVASTGIGRNPQDVSTTRAAAVFPHPGGPWIKTARGMFVVD